MKPTLVAGVTATASFLVTEANTVPALAIDKLGFTDIPHVLATAYMIAMMEGTSTRLLRPHHDDNEGSLGVHIDVSHLAATVIGQTVTVTSTVTQVDDRKVAFHVVAHDGIDLIGEGKHVRAIVRWDRFKAAVAAKAGKAIAERSGA